MPLTEDAIASFRNTVQRFGSVVEHCEAQYGVAVLCTPAELTAKPYLADGRRVVMIDTLRNSTCITVALAAGATDVLLYGKAEDTLAELYDAADVHPGPKAIAGEVEGRPIPRGDLGNSPLEFVPSTVGGMRLFYASTNNGSALRNLMSRASPCGVYWGCNLNAPAIGAAIAAQRITMPLVFLCAGFRGTLALEDVLCAGRILLIAQYLGAPLGRLDDGATLALLAAKGYCDPDGSIRRPTDLCHDMSEWRCGSVLKLLGQGHDIGATVLGHGMPPETLLSARECIPYLDTTTSPSRIVRWSGETAA